MTVKTTPRAMDDPREYRGKFVVQRELVRSLLTFVDPELDALSECIHSNVDVPVVLLVVLDDLLRVVDYEYQERQGQQMTPTEVCAIDEVMRFYCSL